MMRKGIFLAMAIFLVMGCAKKEGVEPTAPAGPVVVGVIKAEGKPLEGVSVEIEALGVSATTAADGTFKLSDLVEGSYEMRISKEGYVTKTLSITVGAEGTLNLGEIELLRAGTVEGVVKIEGETSHRGIKVRIIEIEGLSTETDSEGRYRLTGIPPGSYTLEISSEWLEPKRVAVDVEPGKVLELEEMVVKKGAEISIQDEGDHISITHPLFYRLRWMKTAQMGYDAAYVGKSQNSLIARPGNRSFYHSSYYDGAWRDWGGLQSWRIVEKGAGKVVVEYVSHDGYRKQYTVWATYYSDKSFIKHQVKIKNTGASTINAFESGHEPMLEPYIDFAGMTTLDSNGCTYWDAEGNFLLLYTKIGSSRILEWQGKNPGRMDLVHDNMNVSLDPGKESPWIEYFIGLGTGGRGGAEKMAGEIARFER
jgi:hypothetical protein